MKTYKPMELGKLPVGACFVWTAASLLRVKRTNDADGYCDTLLPRFKSTPMRGKPCAVEMGFPIRLHGSTLVLAEVSEGI